MANSVLVVSSLASSKLAFLSLAIAFPVLLSFLLPPPLLFLPPPSDLPLLPLLSSLLTSGSIFVTANFIVLAILISSGSLKFSDIFASIAFPLRPNLLKVLIWRKEAASGVPETREKGRQQQRRPATEGASQKDRRSESLVGVPAPYQGQLSVVPGSSESSIADQNHPQLKLSAATAMPEEPTKASAVAQRLSELRNREQLAIDESKRAFGTSIPVGSMVRSKSDQGRLAATLIRKTLRKAESMDSVSEALTAHCDNMPTSVIVVDRLPITNAGLNDGDDFQRKCEDFIAKVRANIKKEALE